MDEQPTLFDPHIGEDPTTREPMYDLARRISREESDKDQRTPARVTIEWAEEYGWRDNNKHGLELLAKVSRRMGRQVMAGVMSEAIIEDGQQSVEVVYAIHSNMHRRLLYTTTGSTHDVRTSLRQSLIAQIKMVEKAYEVRVRIFNDAEDRGKPWDKF